VSQTGVYAQDQIKIGDRWVLTIGGRYDWAETETTNGLTGVTTSQEDSKLTGQAGLLYLFANGFAPYVSFATSFEALIGQAFGGVPFEPTTGEQIEAGLKYQPPGSANFVTVSVFEATQEKVTTIDLDHPGFNVQTGELRSRGIETEARGSFRGLNITATYSMTDAEVTRSNTTSLGKRPTMVPEHTAAVWADYGFTGALKGLGLGAGVRHSSFTFANQINTLKVPDITLVDAVLFYDFEGPLSGTRLSLNAANLLDDSYVSACLSEAFCYFGAQRNITASVRKKW
jgi:iron complex outermembrane recepter protein